jgi:hypothetical protein
VATFDTRKGEFLSLICDIISFEYSMLETLNHLLRRKISPFLKGKKLIDTKIAINKKIEGPKSLIFK